MPSPVPQQNRTRAGRREEGAAEAREGGGAHSQHVEMHAECDYNNDDNKLNSNNNNRSKARENENPHSSSSSSSNVPPLCVAPTPRYSQLRPSLAALRWSLFTHRLPWNVWWCIMRRTVSVATVGSGSSLCSPIGYPTPAPPLPHSLLLLPLVGLSGNWRTTANKFSKASRLLGLRFDTAQGRE